MIGTSMLAPIAQAMPDQSRAAAEGDDLDRIERVDRGQRRPDHREADQEEATPGVARNSPAPRIRLTEWLTPRRGIVAVTTTVPMRNGM